MVMTKIVGGKGRKGKERERVVSSLLMYLYKDDAEG